jgi:hypothetical protein
VIKQYRRLHLWEDKKTLRGNRILLQIDRGV